MSPLESTIALVSRASFWTRKWLRVEFSAFDSFPEGCAGSRAAVAPPASCMTVEGADLIVCTNPELGFSEPVTATGLPSSAGMVLLDLPVLPELPITDFEESVWKRRRFLASRDRKPKLTAVMFQQLREDNVRVAIGFFYNR